MELEWFLVAQNQMFVVLEKVLVKIKIDDKVRYNKDVLEFTLYENRLNIKRKFILWYETTAQHSKIIPPKNIQKIFDKGEWLLLKEDEEMEIDV